MLRQFLRRRRRSSTLTSATRPNVCLQLRTLEDRCLLSAWTALSNIPPDFVGTMMLLPNGTVMAQGRGNSGVSNTWYQLTPDASGSYVNGTWSQLASMSLQRLYFGSNVLPNDNVFVVGGEYSGPSGSETDTNTGEIYNSLTNTWSAIANFPQTQFGDDPTAVLSNGQILSGYIAGAATYLYDPSSNTWTRTGSKLHTDRSDEEGFVTLLDGSVLSYDVFSSASNATFQAQRYVPSTGQWVDASNLDSNNPPSLLSSSSVGFELGPAFVLPNGNVFQLGGNGNTAVYNIATDTWSAGPTIPNGLVCDDAPGAELPNGNVIFTADRYFGNSPTAVFEYDASSNTISQLSGLPSDLVNQLGVTGAFTGRMLVLPTGQILFNSGASQSLYVYTPDGGPQTSWQPTITNIQANGDGSYTLTGTQLTGMSEGAAYGDDAEMSSNFPLVQLTDANGNVYYATTSDWTPAVQTGSASVTTQFTLPAGLPQGTYNLAVIASGIASAPVPFSTSSVSAVTAQVSGSTLQIAGSAGTTSVTIQLQAGDPTTEQVLSQGSVLGSFGVGSFDNITVALTGGQNTLTVDATNGDPVPSGGLVYDGGPSNQLVVNYASDSTSSTITLDSTTPPGDTAFGTITGEAAGVISYEYADTSSVTLDTGTSADIVNVLSTATATNIVGATALTVNVGNAGSVQGIQGDVSVGNTSASTTLTVDDSADTTLRHVVLTASQLTGLAPAAINYTGGQVGSFTMKGGTAANTYAIQGTAAGTSFALNVGTGSDTITLADTNNTLDSLQGSLTLMGAIGKDTVTIRDSGQSTAQNYTFGATNFGRTGSATVSFSSLKSLTIFLANAGNTVTVSAAPTFTTTLNGGSGNNTLIGPNKATTWTIKTSNGGLLGTKLTFSSFATLQGGSAADTFKFTAAGSIGSLDGGLGTNKIDYSLNGGVAVIVNLANDSAPQVAGGAANGFTNIKSFGGSSSASDELIGPNTTTTAWQVTGPNRGKAGTVAFTAFENLVGGSGVNTFKISNNASLSGSIHAGSATTNVLDYSLWTTGVTVNLATGAATGIANGISGFHILNGGKSADNLTGGAGTEIIRGGGGTDTITGGSGNDILIGGTGTGTTISAGSTGGRSILIADKGTNATLNGGSAGDILIAGYTTYDTFTTAHDTDLLKLLNEWISADDYAMRIAKIRAGVGWGLTSKTVINEPVTNGDVLNGLANYPTDPDWFWAASTSEITDPDLLGSGGEQVN